MRFWSAIAGVVVGALFFGHEAEAAPCAENRSALGVSRIVEIDATDGPVFGSITKRAREKSFLGPKEVVLTFDDGPMPGLTRSILDTLDKFCTKATFFSVGKMAIAYPETVREILKRGHTLGTHTWSHPMNLPRLKGQQAVDQIESGFAAVSMAAGQPIAPFFRFPGLNDSEALVGHLQKRGIATFTVDVVSNDSYIADQGRLIDRTLNQLQAENGGIALFHDIKPQTARALPTLLAEMKARGYRIVHLRAKAPFERDDRYTEAVRAQVAQKSPAVMRTLMAITDAPIAPAPAVLPPDQADPAQQVASSAEMLAVEPQTKVAAEPLKQDLADRVASATEVAALSDSRPVLKPVRERKAKVARASSPRSVVDNGPAVVATPPRSAQPAAAQPKPAATVISGPYPAGQLRPVAAAPANGIPPPEVIAGSYSAQRPGISPRAPAAVPKSWSETIYDQQRGSGN